MDELAGLRRLVAEVTEDLEQSEAIAARVASYLEPLAATDCSPEIAGFVAVLLHRWYTALEAAFERIERTLVGAPPGGDAWHQELLRLMALEVPDARPAVLRRETTTALLPYLRFRHFLRHAYAVELDPTQLHALVIPLDAAQTSLGEDLRAFLTATREALRAATES